MASQSFEFTARQVGRARATAEAALAAPDGEKVAIKVLARDLLALCDSYDAAARAVTLAERATDKEVSEGDAAIQALRTLYDQAREVVDLKTGVSYESAASFNTPDDFLNAAEDLEGTLETADPSWASPLLASISAAVEAATKEYGEASAARKALQKAVIEREQAEGTLRPVLVRFRRVVRTTFGSRSREYRELLDRRSRSSSAGDASAGDEAVETDTGVATAAGAGALAGAVTGAGS